MTKKRRVPPPPPVVSFECPDCYGAVSVTLSEPPDITLDRCICRDGGAWIAHDDRLITIAEDRLAKPSMDDCDGGGDGPDD